MKKLVLVLAAALLGAALSDAAFAHDRRGRVQFGFHFGAPLGWYGWHYPPPYYTPYPPQVIVVPSGPQTYIERDSGEAEPAPAQAYWWYYCADSRAYYPYVKDCPGGWQRVAPQPPGN